MSLYKFKKGDRAIILKDVDADIKKGDIVIIEESESMVPYISSDKGFNWHASEDKMAHYTGQPSLTKDDLSGIEIEPEERPDIYGKPELPDNKPSLKFRLQVRDQHFLLTHKEISDIKNLLQAIV